MAEQFVHLHLHSQYSLLDGGNRLDRLVERVKELGMHAVAVTDHGNLFGAVEFYNRAKAVGVKPILGIEAYVAPGDRTVKEYTGVSDGGFHLVLLAENLTGWKNLLKLSSDSFLNGFYYKPRMDKSTLGQWSDGLIAINGHLGSSIAHHMLRFVQTKDPAHYAAAAEEARWHARTFGHNDKGEPRFYIEVQRHDVREQNEINPHLVRLARELSLPIVADNDAHFLLEEDYDAHDTLCCISMGKIKTEEHRLRYSRDLYVKSMQQMVELFHDLPEAVANTVKIADRCSVDLPFGENHAPVVKIEKTGAGGKGLGAGEEDSGSKGRASRAKTRAAQSEVGNQKSGIHPPGSTEWFTAFCSRYTLLPFDAASDKTPPGELKARCDEALRELAEAGAVWRYGEHGITDEIRARLDRELKILADKNISAYFLIVWDFVNEARRRGIPSNARGSGVGTMVGYCLGLSNACPVKYGLLFERFTDPDRSEYPDIDIDICQDGRGEVIEYVRAKYGHVAQIITFGTLKARAAIRDVGRVLNIPLGDVDKVCKLVGDGLGTTIDSALAQEADLRKLCDDHPQFRQLIDTARKLEGMARHAGVHAAGVVVATQSLDNIIPLYQPSNQEMVVTQWDGPTVEKVGLLKMDFLGLRTLSIIERAKKLIRQTLSPDVVRATVSPGAPRPAEGLPSDPLDLERLAYDDQKVLDLFRRGETAGVFQFESGGMRNTLIGMKPDRLEDLIACNALFRPGPMDLIPDYNARKHASQPVPKAHPIVEKFTGETYGIMIYQEQVMQIVHELGGIPLRAAYSLIKAISKKKQKDIDKVRPTFIEGSQQQGLSKQQADELFELILKFAGYGFNKSHSTGYAIVAYQTAYLKTYFPVQYMAAVLTYESVSTEKVVEYIDECRRVVLPNSGRRGVEVRPPDINLSDVAFNVVFDRGEPHDADHGHIRFGLGAVKGVGDKAIGAIIEARKKGGPFKSLFDFAERVQLSAVNRACIEALIKCGAFDSVHSRDERAALVAALDSAIQAGQRAAADRESGQMNFFGGPVEASEKDGAAPAVTLPRTAPWSNREMLDHEKSVLGFYVSSHPMHEHRDTLDRFSTATVAQAKGLAADVPVVVGGMLTRVRVTVVKNGRSAGQKMAMITLEDASSASGAGGIDGVIFSDAYAVAAPLLASDRIVFLKGRIDRRREEPNIIVDTVIPVERAAEALTESVCIVLRDELDGQKKAWNGELARLKSLLREASAAQSGEHTASVFLEVHQDGQVATLRLNGVRVAVTPDLPARIAAVLHEPVTGGCCQLLGPQKVARPQRAATLLHDESAAPQQPLLRRSTSHEGEFCASIDRY